MQVTLQPIEGRLDQVDMLRGIAALSVTLMHFTNGNPNFLPDGPVKEIASYGFLGVQVFFVISGFIIPFALWRVNYRMPDCGRFLLKRIVRLDPPYLVAIGLMLLLNALSSLAPGFQGQPQAVSGAMLFAHLGYANVVLGYPWLNPVFWTLAIELQYYLLIAFTFPLFSHPACGVRVTAVLGLIALGFVPVTNGYLLPWLPLFALGILAFQWRVLLLDSAACFSCVILAFSAATVLHGMVISCTALAAAGIILFWKTQVPRSLLFLGAISYSLYLVHVPFGGRVVNLSLRFVEGRAGKYLVVVFALSVSLTAAWLLYKLVELPAQRWASRINYRRKTPESVPVPVGPGNL